MRILYYMPLCPFSRAIRMMLVEKSIEFHPVQENIFAIRPQFLAINPAGEMPVLVEEDGTVFSGPYAIAEYVEETSSARSLLGNNASQRAEVRRLIDWFHGKFYHDVTQHLVFEKIYKRALGSGEPDSAVIRAGKKNVYYHLDYIANLARERHWLAGDTLSLADITAAAHISVLDYLGDVPWEHSDVAREWYALLKSRPSLRHMLSDRVPSFRPPTHYENPDF